MPLDGTDRAWPSNIVGDAKLFPFRIAGLIAFYSKKFLEDHRDEIIIHKSAKAAFDELGVKQIPKVKTLGAEYADVLAAKKQAYAEYRQAKSEAQEMLIAQRNITSLYEAEQKEEEQVHLKEEQTH